MTDNNGTVPVCFKVVEEFATDYWSEVTHHKYNVTYGLSESECEQVMGSLKMATYDNHHILMMVNLYLSYMII